MRVRGIHLQQVLLGAALLAALAWNLAKASEINDLRLLFDGNVSYFLSGRDA